LIETVVIYKLPRLSREGIQTMLQVHDIRESRVYQEAKEEGLKEGVEKGIAFRNCEVGGQCQLRRSLPTRNWTWK
jgi:predicted transposase YdaD